VASGGILLGQLAGSGISAFLESILIFLGAILFAAGGGAAIAIYLSKLFAEKWLNTKFEERLSAFRHEQNKEIERLRLRLNTLMDRTTKLHQWEFDVLPEAWGRLNDAFDKIRGLAFRFDPNLDLMSEEQLNDFLSKSPLANWEQTELKAAADKTKYYASHVVFHLLNDTLTAYSSYGLYMRRSGIFIERGLRDKFHEIDKLMIEALTEQKINVLQRQDLLTWNWEKLAALEEKGKLLVEALEREVQGRLWNADSIS
jgi:hypothetical protein